MGPKMNSNEIIDSDNFPPTKDNLNFVDHISKLMGLAVSQLYLFAALLTCYEVVSRYLFHSPTQWVFETVMVLCASAWMLSAGYITLHKRHIGITVIYIMLSKAKQWYLDLFAYVIGVIALWYFIDATIVRAIEAVMAVERAGSAWNSPQPLILKTMLVSGATLYLAQLLVNLYRHFKSQIGKNIITAIAGLIILRIVLVFIEHAFEATGIVATINGFYSSVGYYLEPNLYVDMDDISIGAASFIIVAAMVLLMMTGMPLGVVTLFVSIFSALFYYGYPGMLLVSTNAYGLLESYPLVAVPLFVLMASILEKAGVAEDLFDAMQIFAGKLRGGVAIQTIVVAVILAAMSGVMS
jgi:TRAP-type mannitol/chloroaromatic compound transport system permease small subunit